MGSLAQEHEACPRPGLEPRPLHFIYYKCNDTAIKCSFSNTFIKGPFKYLNDRFPYPSIYLKSAKDTPSRNKPLSVCHRYSVPAGLL